MTVASNLLKAKLAAGELACGVSCGLGSPQVVEIVAHAGFDYLYLDQQHGLVSLDGLAGMLRALTGTRTTPLVRVLRNDSGLIGQALDAGAQGVIVPMVESRADAEAAAAACRYPPRGGRSWGPLRARFGLGADPAAVNDQVMCMVMIESAAGLAAADQICSVDGIDGVYIGPADLAISQGLQPHAAIQPGAHADAIRRIREACQAAGIVAAISGDPAAMAAEGFRMVGVGSDGGFIDAGVRAALARVQGLRDSAAGPGPAA